MSNISLFPYIKENKASKDIAIDIFLENIRSGYWQDHVLPVSRLTDKKLQTEAKKTVPYVTISGKFSERKVSGLIAHSGFIAIDIDDVDDVDEMKSLLCVDKYVYACFVSISGHGLCALFKINGAKHLESFEGLQDYLFTNYEIIVDPTGKDVSRARFVSFDPYIYINDDAPKFTLYSKKDKAPTKVPDVIFVRTDFDEIVNEIVTRRIDITGTYHTWLKIAFALVDKFGDMGESYFHSISQFSSSYNQKTASRQYRNCLRAGKQGVTIASFYYLAKSAGISIVSSRTRLISQTAYNCKKSGTNKDSAIKLLNDAEGLTPDLTQDIVDQVFENNIKVETGVSPIDDLETWLRQNYNLKQNKISRYIENNGKPLKKRDFNTIFLQAKKIFDKLSFEIFERVVISEFTPEYNPILDFFEAHKELQPTGAIKALFDTIESDTGGESFADYKRYFGTKWLVGIISAAHGKHSPLMLVLSGKKQNTGKTEFFRRLLPADLQRYYGESKLDRDKDDEILMTQKLVILDDEMGGKSKKDTRRLKELTSKQTFSLREPYGSNNVDIERLAVLCGTSNEDELLSDPTGNRRIIPINVLSIDIAGYNKINKVEVLLEAYHLYVSGFAWQLNSDDIKKLTENTGNFKETSLEGEMIEKFFSIPENAKSGTFFQISEIKDYIENRSKQKLALGKIGPTMEALGFIKTPAKIKGAGTRRGFMVIERNPFTPGMPGDGDINPTFL